MEEEAQYARVILPLAVEGTFTYRVPTGMKNSAGPGIRVLVSFGKKRIYPAIVHSLQDTLPDQIRPKPLLEILDQQPLVTGEQLRFWEWMSSYYLCTLGEVMRAAIPSGLRPESESRIQISPEFREVSKLDRHELLLFEVVRDQGKVTLGDLELAGLSANPLRVLKKLVELGAVEINEFVRRVHPRRTTIYVKLADRVQSEKELHEALDRLETAPRQQAFLERFLQQLEEAGSPVIKRSGLMCEPGDSAALAALVKKGIVEQLEREELGKASPEFPYRDTPAAELNEPQRRTLNQIREQFLKQQAVLLHGVASSGKTEIYIHLMKEMLEQEKQVLYLLPEIALTTQIIDRIRRMFGESVGVFHSLYSDSERVHVYRNLLGLTDESPYQVVIGVRSAIFLPFRDLGLIIVDEEHEHTYKQHDPAPRYHARDSAQVLALYHNARVLLGTATPAFETLFNAKSGKFGYTFLPERFGSRQRPELVLAPVREAMKRKQMVSHFTPVLVESIRQTLEAGEQIILFQNRRGYSHYLICMDCGHIPKCGRCDVSLTFHRTSGKLECHYCGHREPMPHGCPSCGSQQLQMKGFGTEKIEDEIEVVFEGIRVGRLDADIARSVRGYEKILRDFGEGKLDMLIGTQMLSKGLDFEKVTLVGVLDADSMLHFPDFRAFERSYQLISQVSGRAGRRKKRGKVVIQTMDPAHPVIGHILRDDYEGLFREQMEERELFGYPPFRRLIRISFRHKVPSILDGAADRTARELRGIFAGRVFGPQYPMVRKVKNIYVKQILLKIERDASFEKARNLLNEVLQEVSGNEVFRSVRISVDVDPY